MYKIAVSSTDGIAINEHFGRAKEFFIFQVEEDGAYQLLERRQTINNIDVTEDQSLQSKLILLSDVDVILVNQIGENAHQFLQSRGKIVFAISGLIDKSLKAYGKRGKLVGKVFLGTGQSSLPNGSGCRRKTNRNNIN